MVTINKIKGLDFNNINEYFDYIADSIVNGQRQQARGLIKDLSKQQKRDALNFFEFSIETGELLTELRQMLGATTITGESFLIR